MKLRNIGMSVLASACWIAASANAVEPTLSKSDYKAARAGIFSTLVDGLTVCRAMRGNTKDICRAQAKGREQIEIAELDLRRTPSPEHEYDLGVAKADAAFDVAKEKCDDAKGYGAVICLREAKSAHVAATTDAKRLEKARTAAASRDRR